MHFHTKEFNDCLRQVFVSYEAAEVDQEYGTALSALQKKVQFPGYRAGKVPFDIIEKNNSDELLRTVVNSMVTKAAEKLYSEGVKLYSEPRFKPLSNLNKNTPFTFSIVFEVAPKIISNIDIDSSTVEFDEYFYDDKMLQQSIQKDFKSLEAVSGKIEEEDTVTVKVLNNGFEKEAEKTLESKQVKSLIGKKTGDKVSLSLDELENYVADFLGKVDGKVDVEIVKVERPKEQDVTDEMVQQISIFKTANEYKEAIKNRFEGMLNEFNSASKKSALLEFVSKNAKVEVPKSEYIRECRRETAQFVENNLFISEISLNDVLADKKIRDDFSGLLDKVHGSIVAYFAVRDIAEKNAIQPDKAVIDKIARSHASEHEMPVDEFKQKASADEWRHIMDTALFETALSYLMGKAKFKAKSKQPLIKTK